MGSQINRVPPGLLSLLGIKSLGTNPTVLADQLLPVLDLSDLYGEALIENINGTVTGVNAVGQWEFTTTGTRFRPGPGELWLVRRCAVYPSVAFGAGTTYNFSICTINAASGVPTSATDSVTGTVGAKPVLGYENFALTAQTAVAVWVNSLTLGIASDFSYAAQIVRLTI